MIKLNKNNQPSILIDLKLCEILKLFKEMDDIRFRRELRFYGVVPMDNQGVTLDILNKELERLRGKLNELQSTTI